MHSAHREALSKPALIGGVCVGGSRMIATLETGVGDRLRRRGRNGDDVDPVSRLQLKVTLSGQLSAAAPAREDASLAQKMGAATDADHATARQTTVGGDGCHSRVVRLNDGSSPVGEVRRHSLLSLGWAVAPLARLGGHCGGLEVLRNEVIRMAGSFGALIAVAGDRLGREQRGQEQTAK